MIRSDAILATNTSSLSINLMAKSVLHPERFIGMHFFNPVHRMPLVEVIPGEKTNPETIVTVVDLCKKLGKTPLVEGTAPVSWSTASLLWAQMSSCAYLKLEFLLNS